MLEYQVYMTWGLLNYIAGAVSTPRWLATFFYVSGVAMTVLAGLLKWLTS